jgi:hypothetical protein
VAVTVIVKYLIINVTCELRLNVPDKIKCQFVYGKIVRSCQVFRLYCVLRIKNEISFSYSVIFLRRLGQFRQVLTTLRNWMIVLCVIL